MPKTEHIELGDGRHLVRLPILYEDRSVIAIDKPAGWMLVPTSWQKTDRNLQTAIISSIAAGDYWARGRNLRFLRYIHRLDGETTGILLFGRSPGAVHSFGRLFESRQVQKTYLAVVQGRPSETTWHCNRPIGPDPHQIGRMRIDPQQGKPAETHFRALAEIAAPDGVRTLVEATPVTGRTHQIRVHLAAGRLPILGDSFYRATLPGTVEFPIALRAVQLDYRDPFTRRPVHIEAPTAEFLRAFGFTEDLLAKTRVETGTRSGSGSGSRTGTGTRAKGH